jgi:hypothetical protein
MAAVFTVLLRLPFSAHRLWDHDSIQFALGVEKYDLAAHHPHPPGYPLYIGILKLLAFLGLDPLRGMVALSILGSAVGAACLVLLVSRLAPVSPERGAIFAAALYAANPLLWFYGELPLIYGVEGGLTVAIAYAALRMADGPRPFLAACALFALAAGLRPSTAVLLAPLFLYGVAVAGSRRRVTLPVIAAGAGLGLVLVLAWLLPLIHAAGGYAAYRHLSSDHFRQLLPHTSILYGGGPPALRHNLEVLSKWGLQGILPGAVGLVLLYLGAPGRIAPALLSLRKHALFLLVWAAPPSLFFALCHVTKAGYTLVHLPALLAAMAIAAGPGLAGRPRAAFAATLAVLGLGAALFLYGQDRRPDQPRLLALVLNEFHAGSIRGYERDLDELVAQIRRYPPAETVLATVELEGTGAAGAEGFLYPYQRHLQWYLPEYPLLFLVPEQGFLDETRGHQPFVRREREAEVPAGTKRIVYVLSAPTGRRLDLGLGEARQIGKTFYVRVVPFRGEAKIGPLTLRQAVPKAAPDARNLPRTAAGP